MQLSLATLGSINFGIVNFDWHGRRVRFLVQGAQHLAAHRDQKGNHASRGKAQSDPGRFTKGKVVTVDGAEDATLAVTPQDFEVVYATVGPNGKFYIVAEVRIGGQDCWFFELDPQTGQAACLDQRWPHWAKRFENGIPPFQFDSKNRIYFVSNTADYCSYGVNIGDVYRLNRYDGKTVDAMFDFCQGTTYLQQWTVVPDGTITAVAERLAPLPNDDGWNAISWLLSISEDKVVTNVTSPSGDGPKINFVRLFPDGNVYVGLSFPNGGDKGIVRYLSATHQLDLDNYWIRGNEEIMGSYSYGSEVFGVPGRLFFGEAIWQYYPTVVKLESMLNSVRAMVGTDKFLVVSGNTHGRSVLLLHNLVTQQESILLEAPPGFYINTYEPAVTKQGIVRVTIAIVSYLDEDKSQHFMGTIDVKQGTLTLGKSDWEPDEDY